MAIDDMPEDVCPYCDGDIDRDENTICNDCSQPGCCRCMPNGLCELCQSDEDDRCEQAFLDGDDLAFDDDADLPDEI